MRQKLPYQVFDNCKPFPASQTIFARMHNDPDFSSRMKAIVCENSWSLDETALGDAAWSLCDSISEIAYDKTGGSHETGERFQADDCSSFTGGVKATAAFMGAALTGVARANRLWIYTQREGEIIPANLDTVLVMAIEMDRTMIADSPSIRADTATALGYAKMAFLTAGMTTHLRRLGWRAIGCGNDTALSVPLAIDTGLGECGRNGILTTAQFGSCVRICKVFTDMPLAPDHPISLGMDAKRETCRRCVNACPVGAICPGEKTTLAPTPSNNPGVMKWPVDGEKCRQFWNQNGACCSNCIAACPYFIAS